MVRYLSLLLFIGLVWGQSEAGARFLLIEPGASATGMGTAQVAYAQSSNMSYYNPAGLSLLQNNDVSISRVRWLPGLGQDRYHNFFSFNYILNNYSAVGGHITYYDYTHYEDDHYDKRRRTYSISYSLSVSNNKSFGINTKLVQQQLPWWTGDFETISNTTTTYSFDIGYLHQEWLFPNLNFGLSLSNLGPEILFVDKEGRSTYEREEGPQPTNFALGFNYTAISSETHKLNFLFDINILLIASYPDMDWDGDGYIGGYDDGGYLSPGDDYNINGQLEIAYTDPLFKGLYTSWYDDWLYPGDIDYGTTSPGNGDRIIGGYDWVDADNDGKVDGGKWFDPDSNGIVDPGENEMVPTSGSPGDEGWGEYNEYGVKEVGSKEDGRLQNEIDQMIINYGAEYQFNEMISLRGGYYSDKSGRSVFYTIGLGIRYLVFGVDYSHYIVEDEGHPFYNTHYFSLSYFF